MSRIMIVATVVSVALTGSVLASQKGESAKCTSSVEIVQDMLANSDSGEKEKGMVATLIDLSTGLCERGRFAEAEDALGVARGILGTEEGAGADKDDDKKT